jgi:hypothetical protein
MRMSKLLAAAVLLPVLATGSGPAWASTPDRPSISPAAVSEGPATIGSRVGAISVTGSPYIFVVGGDGNLWNNFWNPFNQIWQWADLGRPPGTTIAGAVGVTAVGALGNRPYIFVLGGDGNLWLNWWTGNAWSWSNQGQPGDTFDVGTFDVGIEEGLGTVVVNVNYPQAYVRGSDGNAYVNFWNGSGWVWENLGSPNGAGVSVELPVGTTIVGGRPYVFVIGSDGNLWNLWWNGGAWQWDNHGEPAPEAYLTGAGAVTAGGGYPQAYVYDGDSNLWSRYWNGSGWYWSNIGRPVNIWPAETVGITTVGGSGRPYIFVRGSDGGLYLAWWTGNAWSWSYQGQPVNGSVIVEGGIGAATAFGSYPQAYVRGSDDRLWNNYWNGNGWYWAEQ